MVKLKSTNVYRLAQLKRCQKDHHKHTQRMTKATKPPTSHESPSQMPIANRILKKSNLVVNKVGPRTSPKQSNLVTSKHLQTTHFPNCPHFFYSICFFTWHREKANLSLFQSENLEQWSYLFGVSRPIKEENWNVEFHISPAQWVPPFWKKNKTPSWFQKSLHFLVVEPTPLKDMIVKIGFIFPKFSGWQRFVKPPPSACLMSDVWTTLGPKCFLRSTRFHS